MAQRKAIGPYPLGMDMRSDEVALSPDRYGKHQACRSAKNIDFDRDGFFARRRGFVRQYSGTAFHSPYASDSHNALFACKKNALGVYDPILNSFTTLVTMPSAFRTDYAELDRTLYVSNPGFNCRFPPDSLEPFTLAVPLPAIPIQFEAVTYGGLEAGDYTVAYSVLNSDLEESPLSREYQITVQQGGGIAVIGITIDPTMTLRVYASTANGEELYQAFEAPMTAVSHFLGVQEVNQGGRQPATRFLEELPYGHFIDSFDNRLVVAFENFVGFSEAFRPHLWDPRHNFIPMEETVTMCRTVAEGIFISDANQVRFLRNTKLEDAAFDDLDADPAFFGSAVRVPGSAVSEDLANKDRVIVWLSKSGHIAGLPDGKILRLNSDRLKLPSYSVASGCYLERDGVKQVINPVNSEQRDGTGTAVDSDIL